MMRTGARNLFLFSLLGWLLMAAAPAGARTWVVEKDGSGDFTVIQDAVDAASSGDVIEIGPGRYEEFQTQPWGGVDFDLHVLVPEGYELTFVGSGRDATFIGPEDPAVHTNRTYGIAATHSTNLVVSDLGIENCSMYGIGILSGSVDVENCRFYYSSQYTTDTAGIKGGYTEGAVVRNCRFEGLYQGFKTINSPGGVLIEDCEFIDCRSGIYAWTANSSDVRVHDCYFACEIIGPGFLGYAGGEILRCEIVNCILALEDCGVATVSNCTVTRDDGGEALYLTNNLPVTVVDNVFVSNGTVVHCASYGLGTIRNNHFLRTGDGYWIESPPHPSFQQDVDFSLNYWGTTDVEEIADGIWDCHDIPNAYNCVVFEPLAGAVAVQSRSWSEVKALFE